MRAGNSAVLEWPVVVAVSHCDPLVQARLQAALMYERDFAASIVAASDLSLRAHADVVVADYETALELFAKPAHQAARLGTATARVMVVSDRDSETEIRAALDLGVLGYLLQGTAAEEMTRGVRALSRGQLHLDQAVAQRVAGSVARPRRLAGMVA